MEYTDLKEEAFVDKLKEIIGFEVADHTLPGGRVHVVSPVALCEYCAGGRRVARLGGGQDAGCRVGAAAHRAEAAAHQIRPDGLAPDREAFFRW